MLRSVPYPRVLVLVVTHAVTEAINMQSVAPPTASSRLFCSARNVRLSVRFER